jgi:hypothetical protein
MSGLTQQYTSTNEVSINAEIGALNSKVRWMVQLSFSNDALLL